MSAAATRPVFTVEEMQAVAGPYATVMLATLDALERVYGHDALNDALSVPHYDGLIALLNRLAPGESIR